MSSSSSAKHPFLLLSLVAIILDQLSKWEILKHSYRRRTPQYYSRLFDLTLAYNPGAAFSPGRQGGWQKYLLFRSGRRHQPVFGPYPSGADEFGRWGKLGAAMIIGAEAIGNVVDRQIIGPRCRSFLLSYWPKLVLPLALPTALYLRWRAFAW